MSMKSYSSSSPPENLPSERERAIDELVQGRHFAYQLKAFLLQNQNQSVLVPPPAQDLVLNVLNSFTNTLSILNNNPPHHSDGDHPLSSSSDLRKSDDSGDSSRSSSSTKYPRGCYKRRKTSHSWTRDSPDLVDDGNAWRKYGQKQILNAKYPRNYYRCTHKHEQGCERKKQVQRIEEDPPLYRTIYSGNHTCNNLLKANHLYIDYHDSDHANDSSVLLSFNNNEHDQNHPFFATSMKQEDHIHTRNNNEINQPTTTSSSSGYILSGADHDHAAMVINNSSSCTTVADDDHYSFHVEHLMMDDPPQFDEDGLFGVII